MKLSELLEQRRNYYKEKKCFDAIESHNHQAVNAILQHGLVVFVDKVEIGACEISGEKDTSLNEQENLENLRDFIFAVQRAGLNYRQTYGDWGYNKCNYTARLLIFSDWSSEPEITEYAGRVDIGDKFDEDVERNIADTIKRATNKDVFFIY